MQDGIHASEELGSESLEEVGMEYLSGLYIEWIIFFMYAAVGDTNFFSST